MKEIIKRIENLFYEFNPYEYRNCFKSRNEGFQEIKTCFDESPQTIAEYFLVIAENGNNEDREETAAIAADLINYFDKLEMFGVSDILFTAIRLIRNDD